MRSISVLSTYYAHAEYYQYYCGSVSHYNEHYTFLWFPCFLFGLLNAFIPKQCVGLFTDPVMHQIDQKKDECHEYQQNK
jgi:hypothetical protein